MFRKCQYFVLILPFVVSTIFAGPKIKVDAGTIDAGIAVEGKSEKVNAVFTVKNIGNEPLKLLNARPSCGCVSVKYDSLIQPGKSGKIAAIVDTRGFRGGPMNKGIIVNTNAENDSIVRLTIKTTVQLTVEILERYISLNANDTALKSVYVISKKPDLKISEIYFIAEPDPNEKTVTSWKSDLPIFIRYELSLSDITRSDGYKVYKLNLYMPEIKASYLGYFTIKTNHPDKEEIRMRGTLLK